jgi:hypothetical protein
VFTIVKAPDLDYNDDTRLAHYSGGATLERPDMTVKGQDIHAFLRNDSNDSSLDHAVADGTWRCMKLRSTGRATPGPNMPNTTWTKTKLF